MPFCWFWHEVAQIGSLIVRHTIYEAISVAVKHSLSQESCQDIGQTVQVESDLTLPLLHDPDNKDTSKKAK